MSITKSAPELREALLNGAFKTGEPACMQLKFGGTPDNLHVDIKVVRMSDKMPLIEVARVHGIQPDTTVTLTDVQNAFELRMSWA